MKIAHGTFVLAADGGKALLFRNEGDEKYAVLESLAHEEIANPTTRELGSDRPKLLEGVVRATALAGLRPCLPPPERCSFGRTPPFMELSRRQERD